MALLYRGESRKKILMHPLFWMKVLEIVLAIITFPLVVTYSNKAGVYSEIDAHSFNITVQYPFKYTNKTAVYTGEKRPPGFRFDPAIEICAKVFVSATIASCILALVMLAISCLVHRNGSMANKVVISEIFIAVVMTFFVVVTTSFWLYNLFALMKEVRDEIVNIITEIGEDCHDCVEFLPDYTILYSAVGLAYMLFLVWLCNAVWVFRDSMHQPIDIVATSSLVCTLELPYSTHQSENTQESIIT